MRYLPSLLIFAAPLLAMEPQEDRERTEEARAAEEAERAAKERELEAQKKEYAERAEELRLLAEQRSKWGMTAQELRHLIDDLRSKSAETREEAMAAIKRANASLDDLLPLIAQALETAEQARAALGTFQIGGLAGTRTLLFPANTGNSEVISGSADGTDYTLKSLGEGKYELAATKRADDGRIMEKTEDQGTIKELQEKYPFLKGGLTIQVPAAPQALTIRSRLNGGSDPAPLQAWAVAPNAVWAHNVQYQCVPWDGGGRVGVTVLAPSEDLRSHLQLPEGAGFIVKDVVAGSRAEQIGIRRMDILLRLDGELIDSPIQLKKLHGKAGVLEIIRRSETKKIDLATIVEEPKPADAPTPADVEPSGAR